MYLIRVVILCSVRFLSKKVIKPVFKKKTKIEPETVQTDRFQFGYFRTKTSSNWFGSVFSSVARFFFLFFVSVRFFQFQTYKTETEPVGFC
jgi:hypothetical protein